MPRPQTAPVPGMAPGRGAYERRPVPQADGRACSAGHKDARSVPGTTSQHDFHGGGGISGGYEPPVVDATELKNNPKANCIYQNLINGSIMNNLISRYNAPSEPEHAFLGELNLVWKLGDRTETIPIGKEENDSYYSVEIILDESKLNDMSATNVALSMLHEALHAKLIAMVYDERGTTDFKALYAYYKGWGKGNIDETQELQMMQEYSDKMAVALQEFDRKQGIYHDLELYKKALRYDFMYEIFHKKLSSEVYKAYRKVLKESSKNCK